MHFISVVLCIALACMMLLFGEVKSEVHNLQLLAPYSAFDGHYGQRRVSSKFVPYFDDLYQPDFTSYYDDDGDYFSPHIPQIINPQNNYYDIPQYNSYYSESLDKKRRQENSFYNPYGPHFDDYSPSGDVPIVNSQIPLPYLKQNTKEITYPEHEYILNKFKTNMQQKFKQFKHSPQNFDTYRNKVPFIAPLQYDYYDSLEGTGYVDPHKSVLTFLPEHVKVNKEYPKIKTTNINYVSTTSPNENTKSLPTDCYKLHSQLINVIESVNPNLHSPEVFQMITALKSCTFELDSRTTVTKVTQNVTSVITTTPSAASELVTTTSSSTVTSNVLPNNKTEIKIVSEIPLATVATITTDTADMKAVNESLIVPQKYLFSSRTLIEVDDEPHNIKENQSLILKSEALSEDPGLPNNFQDILLKLPAEMKKYPVSPYKPLFPALLKFT